MKRCLQIIKMSRVSSTTIRPAASTAPAGARSPRHISTESHLNTSISRVRPIFAITDRVGNWAGCDSVNNLTVEIQAMVNQAKGSQQSPKTIDYVNEVPLTAGGKPDKKAVRARYWAGVDRSVG